MRKQTGFAQHEFAHGLEIVQRGLVAQTFERGAHLREEQFWLVPQAEERFRAAQSFAGAGNGQYFFGCHGAGTRLAGIATKYAVAAIVTAKIGQRDENFARISNDARLKTLFGGAGGGEKVGQFSVTAAHQADRNIARPGNFGLPFRQFSVALQFSHRVGGARNHGARVRRTPPQSNDT